MWPRDAESEPDPESPDRPRSGRTVPGLRALLPARAFLCSLKGRLLLAESLARPSKGTRGHGFEDLVPAGAAARLPFDRPLAPPCARLAPSGFGLPGLSFITFVCYVVSSASAFLTVPLLEFLLAVYFLFADAMQLNDKWQGLCWPMMDFLRCVTAALIYFVISITAVAKYSDGAYKAAGVFGFFATIVFAIDFYLIFNEVAKFLKQGDSTNETTAHRTEEENNSNSDLDSD
ncbi:CKLF-like MARVEL transmembrane domain-containing protein 3 isoform X1 [Mesocricetus auratus]|uniref:CKLF-like MARVEL transmembrane domain-containing protein 3 isoform X1 n=1 Tax=Mesocricetus auratus TaxID=10036 RepID=A0A3Q0D4H4_MESAU|nr:CKLF-like MARVEL transmembrane domain-containing protein 3 isoform X1 [Mesocricetus auratus]XP_040596714.1 CKLF-like MARVEL transmembrane domain-containing protein 3 isoform X1 [Mesocricetus auratus]